MKNTETPHSGSLKKKNGITNKGVSAGSISFSVANDTKVEVATQGEKYDGNDVTGPPRRPPYEPTVVS